MDDSSERGATPELQRVLVEVTVSAPMSEVWRAWTEPRAIKAWNAATDTWHTTDVAIDLRAGGKFRFRMEAKDGSAGFDFSGVYSNVVEHALISYELEDAREVRVEFSEGRDGIVVRETFDAEATFGVELQRQGWQAILDSFKRFVEATK